MTHRTRLWTLALGALMMSLLGCGEAGKTEDCKKAIANIQRLTGTVDETPASVSRGAIRACRGNTSDAIVKCYINATSLEDLEKCGGGMYEKLFKDEPAPGKEGGEGGQTGSGGEAAGGE